MPTDPVVDNSSIDVLADPVLFAREVLGIEPWDRQAEILSSVAKSNRVTVRSGHGVGKTLAAAAAAIWFYAAHDPVLVVTTAPTDRQVKEVLWGEIRRLFPRYQAWLAGWATMAQIPAKAVMSRVLLAQIKRGESCEMIGFSTDDPQRFQGYHCENMLIVVDEAGGMTSVMFEAVKGLLTAGANNRLLMIGNPITPEGYFYDSHAPGSKFTQLAMSCLDSPNVVANKVIIPGLTAADWVEEQKVEWGERSPQYLARVLGEFPASAEESLIPREWAEMALERGKAWENGGEPAYDKASGRLGCDVARFGADDTVICVTDKHGLRYMESRSGIDLMETVGRIQHIARKWGIIEEAIAIDDTGVGGGVTDRLFELDIGVTPLNFGERADDSEHFLNQRAEIWWGIRDTMNPEKGGKFAIPPQYKAICRELIQPRYKFTSSGQVKLEPKADIKKRLGRSPDHADALALCFAAEAPNMEIETI